MKKILTVLICALFALSISAQNTFKYGLTVPYLKVGSTLKTQLDSVILRDGVLKFYTGATLLNPTSSSVVRGYLSTTAIGLTYTSSTGAFSLTAGYTIPTTTAISNATTAYGWGNWASNFGTTAGTIAQGNDSRITNGQTAFGWGNHAGLYDALNTASGLMTTHNNSYTHGNIANGQAAYTWGNHATAGYFTGTNSTIRALLSSNVTGLTYTNTTGVFSATSGYAIPTTAAFNAKMDTTLFNTRYQSNYDTAFAAAELVPALADSGVYDKGYMTPRGVDIKIAAAGGGADSSIYITETRLTDSLTVLRNQIDALITTMNNSGLLVTSINVAGTGGATTIAVNDGTLQMLANVEPNTAVDTTITWSAINGTGEGTISAGGLLTAVANGTVTARATANDGSGIYGDEVITISNQGATSYTDDFEIYNINVVLHGQGDWIQGQGDFYVRASGEDIRVVTNSADTYVVAKHNNTYSNDQYAEVTVSTLNDYAPIGCGVRLTGSGATLDGYACHVISNQIYVYRFDDGVPTMLDSDVNTFTFAGGDVLKMTISGTSIRIYKNDVLFEGDLGTAGVITDGTYASGVAGIAGYDDNETSSITNFEGGDL